MNTDDAERKDAKEIIADLGWPSDIPVERLVASVYDRAMRAGMIESAAILGYAFDRIELPGCATREDRLMVAVHALCHFAAGRERLEEIQHDGLLVQSEVLDSDEWTSASPRLPSMHGLYEATRREWNRASVVNPRKSGHPL